VCLVENGKLVEVYQNGNETKYNRLEGNIYAGRVADIVPGMQAAFVDYGDQKKGFIHFKDAIPQIDEADERKQIPADIDIRKILKQNQKILVQIKKDSNDKKGAKISTHISLPSKYVAFMPNTNIITISQKIPDGERKEELLKLARENLSEGNGAVIRTSAENADNEEIIKDIQRCTKKWNQIQNSYKNSEVGTLIYKSETVQEKMIIDLKLDKVITNSKEEFEKIKQLLQFEEIKNVKLEFKAKEDLLETYDLKKQISKVDERKIWLNCGGFVTIDKTEALTAIDVNTGKFTGSKDLETTVFKVNKEATIEIAKQLRLRDIGGIIIIDYIDMKNLDNKQKIEELLKEELKKDRTKTQVEGFTKLNLIEMTRKHICSHLDD
jgi:ribonuclease G